MNAQELTTTNILGLFQTDKTQRTSFINEVVRSIEEGEVSPLVVHLQIKSMEDIITSLTSTDEKKNKNVELAKRYRRALVDEAAKHGKLFNMYSAKFEVKETGTKYDFGNCGDPEYKKLLEAAEIAKKALSDRESFLKNVPSEGMQVLDTDSGELITIYPPAKSSSTSVTVSLK